jgi:hypothetical protein
MVCAGFAGLLLLKANLWGVPSVAPSAERIFVHAGTAGFIFPATGEIAGNPTPNRWGIRSGGISAIGFPWTQSSAPPFPGNKRPGTRRLPPGRPLRICFSEPVPSPPQTGRGAAGIRSPGRSILNNVSLTGTKRACHPAWMPRRIMRMALRHAAMRSVSAGAKRAAMRRNSDERVLHGIASPGNLPHLRSGGSEHEFSFCRTHVKWY